VILRATGVSGAFVVEIERIADERGFFARTFSADEFRRSGLEPAVLECSIAYNRSRATLRGLHYQTSPHAEAKLVRCTRGAVFDVAVDLRADSPTHLKWHAEVLDADTRSAFYIPPGCAHGYLTLGPDTELAYQISHGYVPEAASGVRWNDPLFRIAWPETPQVIAERDATFPDHVAA